MNNQKQLIDDLLRIVQYSLNQMTYSNVPVLDSVSNLSVEEQTKRVEQIKSQLLGCLNDDTTDSLVQLKKSLQRNTMAVMDYRNQTGMYSIDHDVIVIVDGKLHQVPFNADVYESLDNMANDVLE
jgi:hypothetical protein